LISINKGLPGNYASYREDVETELQRIIDSNPLPLYEPLYDMLQYHFGWQGTQGYPRGKSHGKFIRPTLCLLCCQAAGGDTSQILPAVAALELVHNFSLIHDDIEDASCERHHRPTVWKLWGQSQAINAGDAMFALAYLALLKLRENGIADTKIMRSVQVLGEACLELCEGQYLDIAYENHSDVSTEDYLKMIAKKTAALMAASTSIGSYLATENKNIVSSLYKFGQNLGMAYQIQDDILGIWGAEEKIGKSVNSDISQKKKTLPVVYGLQNSRGKDEQRLERLYSQESIDGESITEVVEILNRSGARSYAQKLEQQYYHQALAEVEATSLGSSKQAPLKEAAHFLMKRAY
jgi:geranylgeranyl diphosphate synthase, type I